MSSKVESTLHTSGSSPAYGWRLPCIRAGKTHSFAREYFQEQATELLDIGVEKLEDTEFIRRMHNAKEKTRVVMTLMFLANCAEAVTTNLLSKEPPSAKEIRTYFQGRERHWEEIQGELMWNEGIQLLVDFSPSDAIDAKLTIRDSWKILLETKSSDPDEQILDAARAISKAHLALNKEYVSSSSQTDEQRLQAAKDYEYVE